MTADVSPPRWAELLLRASVAARDAESVIGDLLEEYRESVCPARGPWQADVWYVRQALGFAVRRAGGWAVLLSAAFLARTMMDWRLPTADYHARSTVTTIVGAGIFLLAGALAGARSGSFAAGTASGIITAVLAAPIQLVGAAMLLAVWHDPATLAAIRASGGLEEVFTLPLMTILPGLVCATIGGAFGSLTRGRHAMT